ncbi:helix-turn-helix domain-containing protein [Streptomyces avidinii]
MFLTVAEVASALRVSKMTVYRLVHDGVLPSIRVRRSFQVPADAVDEYRRRKPNALSTSADQTDGQ